ncbi:37S ribosomal protein S23, mitochondrial [Erysiphe neolycopersici]|uniref:Small ribosomal subunit protein mS29 n=1 Tax=Erysiphe neolycopersici TaxID=212602 RepID=A0A420HEN2_9PEZI|nr:37S ribosomal protein S23, mitochondrial [Erysiphe neolycopersici]
MIPEMVSLSSLAKPSKLNHALPLIFSKNSFNLSNYIGNVSFSTSITRSERNAPPARGTNTLRIAKKNVVRDKGRPPAVGERKNYRKRIVLSNSNALSVTLPVLDFKMIQELVGKPIIKEQKVTEPKSLKLHNKNKSKDKDQIIDHNNNQTKLRVSERKLMASVVGLSDETIDSLRASKAFKITQSWELFRQPGVLIREHSKIMNLRLLQAQEQKSTVRMVIDGAKGSGKSMMLLYAMATAFVNDWVVINIPEAQDVTNAVTEYAPIPDSNLFSQNSLVAELLDTIAKANSNVLRKITVKQAHPTIATSLEPNCSIYRLCELGAREPEFAWPFFLNFWSEITREGNPPIMMCLDGLSHILQNSLYLKTDLSYVHSQDLSIVKHFTDYLSGAKTVPNGGAFLAATNRSHAPVSASLELAIKRSEDRVQNRQISQHDPYEKNYDYRSDKILADVEIFKLGGLTKNETRGLLEYWAKSGILRSRVDEKTVAEKWVLAGHGIAGEIQRGLLARPYASHSIQYKLNANEA